MKKLVITCMLAGGGSLFAQNLDITDLRFVLRTSSLDSINQYLQPKGFNNGERLLQLINNNSQINFGNSWYFHNDDNTDNNIITVLYKWTGSTGAIMRFETSNAYFYAHLLNQLEEEGFSYSKTIPGNKQVAICLFNGNEEICVALSNMNKSRGFQFTFQADSPKHQYPVNTKNGLCPKEEPRRR
jgi:hypothetical protein